MAPKDQQKSSRGSKTILIFMIFPVLFPVVYSFERSEHKFSADYFISQSPEVTLDGGKKIQLEYSSPEFEYSPLFESWDCHGIHLFPCTDGTHQWHVKPELYFNSKENNIVMDRIPIPWPPAQRLDGLAFSSEIKLYAGGKNVVISEVSNNDDGNLNFKILSYNYSEKKFDSYQAAIRINIIQDGLYNSLLVPGYSEIRYLELYPESVYVRDQYYHYPERDKIFTNIELNAAVKQIKLIAYNFKTNTAHDIQVVNLTTAEYKKINYLLHNENKAFLDKDNNQHFLLYPSQYCYANNLDCGDPFKFVFSEKGELIAGSYFVNGDENFYQQLSDDLSNHTTKAPLHFFGLPVGQKLLYLKELMIYNIFRPFIIWLIVYLVLLKAYFKRKALNPRPAANI